MPTGIGFNSCTILGGGMRINLNQKKEFLKKFKVGSIYKLDKHSKGFPKIFVGATIEIVSNKDFYNRFPDVKRKIGEDRVVGKIISSSNKKTIGHYYPFKRIWLSNSAISKCTCDLKTTLMRYGCQCGGI
jgi:hypothetical protein